MSLIGKNVEEQMWNFFMARVGNAYGVAALMGHWFAESGLNPRNLQNSYEKKLGYTDESYTKAVDNGSYTNFARDSAGYGLAQWTYWSRKQNLLSFAQGRGCSIGDTEMQFEFGYQELSTGYKSVLAVMKSAKSVREASDVLLTQYERPADQSEAVKVKRAGYGEEFYKKYAGAGNKPQNGGNTMSIMVGSARIDENGQISGGAAGDQKQTSAANDTVGEVSMQAMYAHSKGWYILRPKNPDHAGLIASKMIQACNNANIGYDQGNRLGVITYGIGTSVKTECDCSSLVRACVKEATGKDPGNFTTANEASMLEATGLFDKRQAYVSQSNTPVFNGDVLVTKTKGHTVIVTSGNPRTSAQGSGEGYYPKYTGTSGSITAALAAVGEKDTSKENRAKIAAANNIANYNFTAEQNTKMVNLLKAGTLKRAGAASGNTSYYPQYTGTSSSIVSALTAVGEKDTSIVYRKKIAEANGISGYTGTAAQNTSMVKLLKAGKLKKA
ncbi:MAG: phage tail tip lysozyme [Butyrivibrio sp.]|nr:phage tail tip lysozyme [Butyrivibrio sp.]